MVNENQNSIPESDEMGFEEMNMVVTFYKLWNNLTMWMRSYMVSLLGNLDNVLATLTQMYITAPLDFYNTFFVLYDEATTDQFHNLLSDFVASYWRMVAAVWNDDSTAADASIVELYQRSEELALFLDSINAYWDYSQWKNLLDQYIRLWIAGLAAMNDGNYKQEIKIYEQLQEVAFNMGDYMARGIIANKYVFKGEI